MKKTTAQDEIQVILQEYIGKKEVLKVAEAVYAAMQAETQHTHNGKKFFIKEDETGELMLTMESTVKKSVEAILYQNLEKDEVQECLEQLMAGSISNEKEMTAEIETISVEGFDSQIYSELLKHTPANAAEERFLENLKVAIEAGVEPFKVPVCDPSIAEDGSLQFVADCKPAVGHSYNELEELATKNGVQLGSKNQYVLFLATIIHRLIEEGFSKANVFYAVCNDSKELGHYRNSTDAKRNFESTGSRKVAGKCDLANTMKVLAKDEEAGGLWLAGGCYFSYGYYRPLACLYLNDDYDYHYYHSVGWFVL